MESHRSTGYEGLQTIDHSQLEHSQLEHDNGNDLPEKVRQHEEHQTRLAEADARLPHGQRSQKDPWKKRAIWIGVVLGILVVAAAVAGGVAGSVAVRNASEYVILTATPTSYEVDREVFSRAASFCPTITPQNNSCLANVSSTQNTSTQNTSSTLSANTTFFNYTLDANGAPTNISVPKPNMVPFLALDCPAIDSQIHPSATGSLFVVQCGLSLSGADLVGIVAYSLYDCIDACATMNVFLNASTCKTVHFTTVMAGSYASNLHSNCWLKTAVIPTGESPTSANAKLLN